MANGGMKRRTQAVTQMVERLGFTVDEITPIKGHFNVYITDDVGNSFVAHTGTSCSKSVRRALLNFKQDVRRLSQQAKGLIDRHY